MQSHYVSLRNGPKLYVEEYGNPYGRPILFIHGMSQSRLCWAKQVNSMLSDEFRIVIMDIRGHGLSDKPRRGYDSIENWADDIHAVITELGLYRPVVVAWSYGGLIICDYIRIYGQENISGINLVAAGTTIGTKIAMELSSPQRRTLTKGLISNNSEKSMSAIQDFVKLCFYNPLSAYELYFILGYNAIVPPYVRRGLISRTVSNDDLLAKINKPVLITHGLKDRILLVTSSLRASKIIPNSSLSLYPDAGHTPFMEAPDRFNMELRLFAQGIS